MSLFSSLVFLYPGPPPVITVGDLRAFADRLQGAGLTRPSRFTALELKFGEAIDSDYEDTMPMVRNKAGNSGMLLRYPWDYEARDKDWADLWPAYDLAEKRLYRAYLSIGSLEPAVSKALTAMASPETTHEFFAPDQLSLQIGPAMPSTLETEEPICFSLLSVRLSGNGFLTWQPLAAYWDAIRSSLPVATISQICRDSFPAPEFEELNELREDIGPLFLNDEGYTAGDWIISVSETG
jgi:hypothetical protein